MASTLRCPRPEWPARSHRCRDCRRRPSRGSLSDELLGGRHAVIVTLPSAPAWKCSRWRPSHREPRKMLLGLAGKTTGPAVAGRPRSGHVFSVVASGGRPPVPPGTVTGSLPATARYLIVQGYG